ncbi:MAG: 3-deoxy-manno-octulosonate cytidylyltransferase [Bacteroidales bacterium]
MNTLGIIPARWGSTRFPGKPLVKIGDKSMIQRVFEQSKKALDNVFVATDDQRIADEVNRFGGQVVMTRSDHKSGTDRCAEALFNIESLLLEKFDVVVNIQGDEPFIQVKQIMDVTSCFNDPDVQIATVIKKITTQDALLNPNNPKVVLNLNNEAIYFSRSIIPFIVNTEVSNWLEKTTFYEHLGLYAYKSEVLRQITKLPPSVLEISESLEQNRWIENAFRIKVVLTDYENISIDTQEDLQNILKSGNY